MKIQNLFISFSLSFRNSFSSAWAVAPRTARVTFTGKYIFLLVIKKIKIFQKDKIGKPEKQQNFNIFYKSDYYIAFDFTGSLVRSANQR